MSTAKPDNPNAARDPRRARVVRNAVLLGALALAVYAGFIAMGVLRG